MKDIDSPDHQKGIEVSSGALQVDSGQSLHHQVVFGEGMDLHQEDIVTANGQEKIVIEKGIGKEKGVKNAGVDQALEVNEIQGKSWKFDRFE